MRNTNGSRYACAASIVCSARVKKNEGVRGKQIPRFVRIYDTAVPSIVVRFTLGTTIPRARSPNTRLGYAYHHSLIFY